MQLSTVLLTLAASTTVSAAPRPVITGTAVPTLTQAFTAPHTELAAPIGNVNTNTKPDTTASATLTLEIDDTFIQGKVDVAGSLALNRALISAFVATVDGVPNTVCQAFDRNHAAVGAPFDINTNPGEVRFDN